MNKPKTNYTTEAGVSNQRDRCQTPDYAIDPLLPYLPKAWMLWEPAAGEGYLADALAINGYRVMRSDLLDGSDYFADSSIPFIYNAQITNPPFSRKFEWLERCYLLGKPFALLMPVETIGASAAQRLFDKHGIEVIFMDKRIDFKMPNKGWGGSAQFPSAWFTYGLNIGRQMTFARITKGKQRERAKLQLGLFAETESA